MCDGIRTLFLVNRDGSVLDIVGRRPIRTRRCRSRCRARRRTARTRSRRSATRRSASSSARRTRSRSSREGVQIFSFRNARWHLLDLKAKYDMWEAAVGHRGAGRAPVPDGDRSRRRAAGRAVRRAARSSRRRCPLLVAPADQLDAPHGTPGDVADARPDDAHAARADGQRRWTARSSWAWRAPTAPRSWTRTGRLLAIGAILLHPEPPEPHSTLAVEGARTTAAMAAGRMGAVLKVSEDGLITFYDQQERIWDI